MQCILFFSDSLPTQGRYFPVQIQPNTSSLRLNLQGDLILEVSSSAVTLHQVQNDELTERIKWPLIHINKFKCEDLLPLSEITDDLVTLETSL